MIGIIELRDEVRILELEVRKLELENRLVQLKAEQFIDEKCVGCAGPCVMVDVSAQKKLDEYKETVLIERSDRATEKEMINRKYSEDLRKKNVIIEGLRDQNIEDLKELYSLDKAELKDRIAFDAEHIDRLNKVITSHINEIRDLETTLDGLKAELSARKSDMIIKVVDVVKRWNDEQIPSRPAMNQIAYVIKDHHVPLEGSPKTSTVVVAYGYLELP